MKFLISDVGRKTNHIGRAFVSKKSELHDKLHLSHNVQQTSTCRFFSLHHNIRQGASTNYKFTIVMQFALYAVQSSVETFSASVSH